MLALGETGRAIGARVAVVALLLGGASACAGSATPAGRTAGRSARGAAEAAPSSGTDAATLAAPAPAPAPATPDPGRAAPTTGADAAPGTDATTAAFATGPRSAPASGPGTALLRGVRTGRYAPGPGTPGYERIVLELSGRARPGYRVRWLERPDGGDPAADGAPTVAGAARLEVVLTPASGVDPTDGSLAYDGPDRVPVIDGAAVVRDVVRTGDYEGVLTWVVGADAPAPFRVLLLEQPSRLVIDLQAG